MKLNLPILDHLENSQNILIVGAGGGFDIFIGLPIYFTLKAMGKTVHLANYSFSDAQLVKLLMPDGVTLIENELVGARGNVTREFPYFPEGYLAQWFREIRGEDVTVWMFPKSGAAPLHQRYQRLVEHLKIDAIILVDGGVDSLMRGDEEFPGSLVEDSISLAAVDDLDVPVKLLGCLGFGTETEERVCHHHALENIAALMKMGGFAGSCALTPQMSAFQQYESACLYVWEQPKHLKSHISTRIIPAVRGEFGNHHMYPGDKLHLFISPLMSLYWFFDANAVIKRHLLINQIKPTETVNEVLDIFFKAMQDSPLRPHQYIPY